MSIQDVIPNNTVTNKMLAQHIRQDQKPIKYKHILLGLVALAAFSVFGYWIGNLYIYPEAKSITFTQSSEQHPDTAQIVWHRSNHEKITQGEVLQDIIAARHNSVVQYELKQVITIAHTDRANQLEPLLPPSYPYQTTSTDFTTLLPLPDHYYTCDEPALQKIKELVINMKPFTHLSVSKIRGLSEIAVKRLLRQCLSLPQHHLQLLTPPDYTRFHDRLILEIVYMNTYLMLGAHLQE